MIELEIKEIELELSTEELNLNIVNVDKEEQVVALFRNWRDFF